MPHPHKLDEVRILEEAARLVDEHGLEGLSTRVLAERLGARAPSLYRYYPEKETLVRAVSARFLADLTQELAPHLTLTALARAYWQYAARHPRRYDAVIRHAREEKHVSKAVKLHATEPLLTLATRLDPERPLPTARAIWSYLHGAVNLRLHTEAHDGLDPEEAFELGLAALTRGLTNSSD